MLNRSSLFGKLAGPKKQDSLKLKSGLFENSIIFLLVIHMVEYLKQSL